MHETTTKRPGRAGKYIRRALLALAAVILAAVLVLLALFQAELRTLNTIERVDDTDLFTMTYLGDYGLDDFLAQGGASNDNELLDFLMQKLLKGLPLHFDIPDLGCSTFAAETPEGDAIFGRNFDMYYSPALFVRTAPEDGYRSISMVNLSYIGFGEGKLPTSLLDSLLTLAAPIIFKYSNMSTPFSKFLLTVWPPLFIMIIRLAIKSFERQTSLHQKRSSTMHETTTKRPGRAGKYIRRALLALAAVILAAVLVLLALFQAELRTLNTIERVDDTDLFTMTYLGDYGLDDFLAQGGASNDNELLDFLMQKLLKGLPLHFDIPDLGCSTFAAETPEGDAIFGRNFDMYYSPALFVRTAPEDGYRSISMVNLSYIGFGEGKLPTSLLDSLLTLAAPYVPLDGLNEKGLAVGVLLIDTEPTDQQTDKPDITTTTAIRLLLDRAATVDEALALLSQYDMHASANSCYHFQIADAAGRAVVVEYIGDEMNVVESPRATNFLLTEGDWDFGRGQDRFAVLEETMEASGGVLTEEEGMALLQAVSQQPQPGKDSSTQWSCLYNQVRGTVDIAVAMDYDSLYHFAIDE